MSCLIAKPVVDRLEEDLAGRAEVVRIGATSQVGRSLAARYGVRGVPTIIVLDSAGGIVYAQAGTVDRDGIVVAVEQLLVQ